jgi:hypothetical protein
MLKMFEISEISGTIKRRADHVNSSKDFGAIKRRAWRSHYPRSYLRVGFKVFDFRKESLE